MEDLTGRKFGRLTVIRRVGKNKKRESLWLCQCVCGNQKIVVSVSLKKGYTKSCGCLKKEVMSKRETRMKISMANKGCKHSQESRMKISVTKRSTSKAKYAPEKLVCPVCKKEFTLSNYQRYYYRKNPFCKLYCSRECSDKNRIGQNNPKWRGGKTICDGYIYTYQPNHPYATEKGYVAEHRLIIERLIGRYLSPEEVIHHINGDPTDNRQENLILLPNESAHRKLHAKYRTRDKKNRFSGHKEVHAYI